MLSMVNFDSWKRRTTDVDYLISYGEHKNSKCKRCGRLQIQITKLKIEIEKLKNKNGNKTNKN